MRDKKSVAKLVGLVAKLVNLDNPVPFIYASGKYSSEFEKTTVVLPIAISEKPSAIFVWDLRQNPDDFTGLSEDEILAKINAKYEERIKKGFIALPVKELCLNKCPAVAPIGTLDKNSEKRIKLNLETVEKNFAKLKKNHNLIYKIQNAFAKKIVETREKFGNFSMKIDVEDKLYDGFPEKVDAPEVRAVAAVDENFLADFHPDFRDERLTELLLRFKARNFPRSLSADEKTIYENYRAEKLRRELPKYLQTLMHLGFISRGEEPESLASESDKIDFYKLKNRVANREIDEFILEELQLWAESIWPETE
jgi:exodeoxyribonuclease-1